MRDSKGRYEVGVSGNPLGRPRAILSIRDLARSHTDEAISTLAEIMRDPEAPANARISAASELLNRGYGRSVDQKAMIVMSQQHELPREVRDLTTSEIIGLLVKHLPFEFGAQAETCTIMHQNGSHKT